MVCFGMALTCDVAQNDNTPVTGFCVHSFVLFGTLIRHFLISGMNIK
jgi:hypothetical protein